MLNGVVSLYLRVCIALGSTNWAPRKNCCGSDTDLINSTLLLSIKFPSLAEQYVKHDFMSYLLYLHWIYWIFLSFASLGSHFPNFVSLHLMHHAGWLALTSFLLSSSSTRNRCFSQAVSALFHMSQTQATYLSKFPVIKSFAFINE